jgi:hypothetical protein
MVINTNTKNTSINIYIIGYHGNESMTHFEYSATVNGMCIHCMFFVWSWGYYYKQAPYKQHMFITAMEYIEDIQAFFSSRGKK